MVQKQEEKELEEEEETKPRYRDYRPPPYNPNQAPAQPPPVPQGAVGGIGTWPQQQPEKEDTKYKNLRREIEQCKKDIENFPFDKHPNISAFPLREVPNGVDGNNVPRISFVQEPLKASEVRAF